MEFREWRRDRADEMNRADQIKSPPDSWFRSLSIEHWGNKRNTGTKRQRQENKTQARNSRVRAEFS